MSEIPKIIHQIWLQGERDIPDKYKPDIKKLVELNRDFSYYLWDITTLYLKYNTITSFEFKNKIQT